ncbi:MAG: carbon-nitrogen hydrolase family protein [Desulfomicrobiaceae bacterium]|nr:carbon-nitrogen hydrolase family protein [Desulfomicrobiaceae bacterium]
MRIAIVQTQPAPGGYPDNLAAMARAGAHAAEMGAALVLFPELADFGYDLAAAASCARDLWPRTAEALGRLAYTHRLIVVCGVALPTAHGLTNALAVWDKGGALRGSFAKMHLFRTPKVDETAVFLPGSTPVAIQAGDIRLGLAVCFDLRFPELFRIYRDAGCHGALVAAAWPRKRRHIWQALLLARAAENGMAILGANHTGDAPFPLAGFSAAVSANAELEALGEAPDILVAQVSPATAHLDPTPCRRKDLYGAPPSLCHVLEL